MWKLGKTHAACPLCAIGHVDGSLTPRVAPITRPADGACQPQAWVHARRPSQLAAAAHTGSPPANLRQRVREGSAGSRAEAEASRHSRHPRSTQLRQDSRPRVLPRGQAACAVPGLLRHGLQEPNGIHRQPAPEAGAHASFQPVQPKATNAEAKAEGAAAAAASAASCGCFSCQLQHQRVLSRQTLPLQISARSSGLSGAPHPRVHSSS